MSVSALLWVFPFAIYFAGYLIFICYFVISASLFSLCRCVNRSEFSFDRTMRYFTFYRTRSYIHLNKGFVCDNIADDGISGALELVL